MLNTVLSGREDLIIVYILGAIFGYYVSITLKYFNKRFVKWFNNLKSNLLSIYRYVFYKARVDAYVDGSYSEKTGKCGYGITVWNKGTKIKEIAGYKNNEMYTKYKNLSGELLAVYKSIEYAKRIKCRKIVIHYDLCTIEDSIKSGKTSKHPMIKKYQEYIKRNQNKIEIEFKKIETKNEKMYHKEAHHLARQGAGIEKRKEIDTDD